MPLGKDRTSEFFSAVESVRNRSLGAGQHQLLAAADRQRLLPNAGSSAHPTSDFAKAAFVIARDINATMSKVHKFATLAKRKSLFDDRPVEINELVYIIKQDIARLNLQIGKLSEFLAASAASAPSTNAANSRHINNRQTKEHSHNVITSLQSRLASASDEFKTVLEVRFQNMKEQQSRRDQYSFAGAGDPGSSSGSAVPRLASDSPLYTPERRTTPMPSGSALARPAMASSGLASDGQTSPDHHLIDMTATQSLQQTTMLATAPTLDTAQMEYIESRSQAIESIEQAISELGQIYQNFAAVLATQREMVQRIDDNVQDVQVNIEGAHAQLVKYYQNISSNRALMLKVFAVLLTFFLIFVAMT